MKWENIGSHLQCRQGPRLEDKGIRLLMEKLWKYWAGSFVSGYCWPFLTESVSVISIQAIIDQHVLLLHKTDKNYISQIKNEKLEIPLSWKEVLYFSFSVADSTHIVSSLNLILHIPALYGRQIWARNILCLNWDKKRNLSSPQLRNYVLLEIQYQEVEGGEGRRQLRGQCW